MLKKTKIPHTYVIVFAIIVFSAILTWIVPGGEFERITVQVGESQREVIKSDSFTNIDHQPQTWEIFSAIFDGFVDKADIIAFILLIGGAFWIMNSSRAIDVGIYSFLGFTKKLEHHKALKFLGIDNIIITLIMLMFSLFGAIFGMSEETIAFVIIFVPLAITMGYDSIVGVSMCFVAAGLGFAGALLNPFTIGIAQGLSDLPLFSGIEYRFFCWIVINVVGIAWILRYAAKIKKDPKRSPVYEVDEYWRKKGSEEDIENIKYSTPMSAWITFLVILVVMVIYSFIMPETILKVGNSSSTLPVIPVLTVVYLITSILSLRKSAHFFVLNLLMFTIIYRLWV